MDLLEQCELDDEKLMGKSSRQRGPKVGKSESEVGRHGYQEKEKGEQGPRASWDMGKGAKKRKREKRRQVGRCLELTPKYIVIQKNKEGGSRLGEKEKNQKEALRKDPTPLGDSCQLSLSLCPRYLSFCLSVSLSFSLSHTPICPLDFPRQHITSSITLLHSIPSPPSPFSSCPSTSTPHWRAKLAGTLKESVRDCAALERP